MSNDAARHQLVDVLALVQDQMSDLAVMQKKRAALTAHAAVADGTVEVTVDAQGMVTQTVVDESYLDEFEFAELGDYITAAAQAANREVGRKAAELLVPLTERRKAFPSLADVVDGAPDFKDLMPDANAPTAAQSQPADDDDGEEPTAFPTVRRS